MRNDAYRCGSEVAVEEVGIGGEGCDEMDCSGFLREILSHCTRTCLKRRRIGESY